MLPITMASGVVDPHTRLSLGNIAALAKYLFLFFSTKTGLVGVVCLFVPSSSFSSCHGDELLACQSGLATILTTSKWRGGIILSGRIRSTLPFLQRPLVTPTQIPHPLITALCRLVEAVWRRQTNPDTLSYLSAPNQPCGHMLMRGVNPTSPRVKIQSPHRPKSCSPLPPLKGRFCRVPIY